MNLGRHYGRSNQQSRRIDRFSLRSIRRELEVRTVQPLRAFLGGAFIPHARKLDGMAVLVDSSIVVVVAHLALLFDPCVDHLCSKTRSQASVFPAFKEHSNDDIGIATRSDSDEPAIVFVLTTF